MRPFGMTPGQWLQLTLVVVGALIIYQVLTNGIARFGGSFGRSVVRATNNATGLS